MRYNFDVHHYGPFCPTIMHDVEWLAADDVVEDCSDDSRYSNYKPGTGWSQLAIQFNAKLTEYAGQIESLCKAFSDMRPETLELIATLDFSYRWVRATGGIGPWRDRAVSKFKAIKKDKFTQEQIDRWYDVLVEVGLVEA